MKKTFIVLVAAILVLSALLIVRNQTAVPENAKLFIVQEGSKNQAVSNLSEFETERFVTARGDSLSGYSLEKIFAKLKIKPDSFSLLEFNSEDGGKISVEAEELDKIYLCEQKKADKEFIRLIIPSDNFGQRWLKYVKEIHLKK